MPRKPRDDYPGAWQHVMHRGARRAPIFKDDSHCVLFLDTLSDVVDRFEIEAHAYSLMPNHYHLLLRSVHGNLSDGMRHLNGTYTQRVNAVHRWDGPVFRGRFRSQPLRDETNLSYVLAYIHLNPLRANLIARLDQDAWTSHRQYLGRDLPYEWLSTSFFLDLLGGKRRLHEYVLGLHRGSIAWPDELALRTGWFAKQGEVVSRRLTRKGAGRLVGLDSALVAVREISGATPVDLRRAEMGPRANPARRFATWALARQTLLTHSEIGELLGMSAGQVSNVLRCLRKSMTLPAGWVDSWHEVFDK